MPTNTRKAYRRTLRLDSLEQLDVELDRIRTAHHAGTLRTSGNWTAGQTLGHLAKWIGWGFDGFPFTAPFIARFFGKLLKKQILKKPFNPGINFKPATGDLGGEPEYDFEEGWDRLQAQLDRIRAGESLAGPNPLMGSVTHDEAIRIHLNHAMLHLSFLHFDGMPMSGES